MTVFKARPGVLLLEVCGEYLLVATGEARDVCPNITHINTSGAVLWKLILEEKKPERIIPRAQEELKLSPGDALRTVLSFTSKLMKSGYLIQAEEEP